MHTNVVTTVDTMTAPLTEVFFPSLVACNINQVNPCDVRMIYQRFGWEVKSLALHSLHRPWDSQGKFGIYPGYLHHKDLPKEGSSGFG